MSYRRHSSTEVLTGNDPLPIGSTKRRNKPLGRRAQSKIFDDSAVMRGYDSVPLIDMDVLPRGGISFETKTVGRIQVCYVSFGCWLLDTHMFLVIYISHHPNVHLLLFYYYYYFSLVFLQKQSKIAC
jgi:hypothetical protein